MEWMAARRFSTNVVQQFCRWLQENDINNNADLQMCIRSHADEIGALCTNPNDFGMVREQQVGADFPGHAREWLLSL
eukprot:4201551-Lingulodinium_polyedra.AAC.1